MANVTEHHIYIVDVVSYRVMMMLWMLIVVRHESFVRPQIVLLSIPVVVMVVVVMIVMVIVVVEEGMMTVM